MTFKVPLLGLNAAVSLRTVTFDFFFCFFLFCSSFFIFQNDSGWVRTTAHKRQVIYLLWKNTIFNSFNIRMRLILLSSCCTLCSARWLGESTFKKKAFPLSASPQFDTQKNCPTSSLCCPLFFVFFNFGPHYFQLTHKTHMTADVPHLAKNKQHIFWAQTISEMEIFFNLFVLFLINFVPNKNTTEKTW